MADRRGTTKTGGRSATDRFIPGEVALAVGCLPSPAAPSGWRWSKLSDIARMESGHTPSRKHSEYWGGDVPWIGIRDAKAHHGETIHETVQTTNQLGIAKSSARILPAGTVCLSRTASVGYVVVMGRPMATSQDFANWICSDAIEPHFLKYLLLAEQKSFPRFASGATHQTIYYPELKAFHVCLPPLSKQRRIVAILDEVFEGIDVAVAHAERNLANAREIFDSYLNRVFAQKSGRWVERKLGDVCQTAAGGTPLRSRKEYYDGGSIPWLLSGEVGRREILSAANFITDKGLANSSAKIFPSKSVLIAMYGATAGEVGILRFPAATNQAVCGIMPDKKLAPEFLYYTFLYKKSALVAQAAGNAQPNISQRKIRDTTVPLIAMEEQLQIVCDLDVLAHGTQSLESIYDRKLAALAELKQSILQKAFTGELTPKEAERQMAVA